MADAQRYRLRLSKLDFVSLVDDPAQPNAKTLLIKRKGAAIEGETHAKFVKSNDDLGVAFFWAFTSTNPDGSDHYDLHGDAIAKDNLVKIAMDFMIDGGGAVDEMHDGKSTDARAVAFPMDPEIAKAFGVVTKTAGIMVMIKLNEEQLSKLRDGTYTGVSIAGLGVREPVRARKSNEKRYITDEVLGHQHEATCYVDGNAWMSGATAEGGTSEHRHAIIRDAEGKLIVLADAGHTHALTEVPRVIVAPEGTTVVPEEVAARATRESPRADKSRNVNLVNKEIAVDELAELKALKVKLEAKIAELEAANTELKSDAELTDEEKSHLASLAGSEAKRFRGLEKTARLAEVAKVKDADKVIVTFKGVDYRASMGAHVVELAKQAKEQADLIEKASVAKAATEMFGGLGGTEEDHQLIAAALLKGIPADKLPTITTAVKGWREQAKARTNAPGFDGQNGGTGTGGNPYEALSKGLTAFCKTNSITQPWTVGLEKFKATDEGAALNRAYVESLRAG